MKYFLSILGINGVDIAGSEVEVTREEWLTAERRAGFWPTHGGDGPATGGFSGGGVHGRIEYDDVPRIPKPEVW